MSMRSLIKFIRKSPLGLLLRIDRTVKEAYRAGFVSTAIAEGIYDILAEGPAASGKIADSLGIDNTEGLEAWLDLGVSLGELSSSGEGYSIRGALSTGVMDIRNDTWQAFLRARVEVILNYITQAPSRLKHNGQFELSDAYGELFARSSRTVEPLILGLIENVIPDHGPFSLLEVGCGSGIYIKHACLRNPQLEALGLELQQSVAGFAQKNMTDWNIDDRVRIETADIRQYEGGQKFDMATLHNLIYYFPLKERSGTLGIIGKHLKPGGRLLMTTMCRTGSPSIEAMNLWSSMTKGCGPLPENEQMLKHLAEAGFVNIRNERMIPGFYMYEATKA